MAASHKVGDKVWVEAIGLCAVESILPVRRRGYNIYQVRTPDRAITTVEPRDIICWNPCSTMLRTLQENHDKKYKAGKDAGD